MGTPLREWREPPESRFGQPGRYDDIIRDLKSKPGRWMAIYATKANSAGSIARGLKQRYPGVEALTRKSEEGATEVFARWRNEGPVPHRSQRRSSG